MQEWHRHDGFLKAMSLNIDVGCGRGLLPPEVQKVHYGTCKFLKKCIEHIWSESICSHGQVWLVERGPVQMDRQVGSTQMQV